MAKGDPIFAGAAAQQGGAPVLQPGSRFTDRPWGLDDGKRTFLVHPLTPRSAWPQKGAPDAQYPSMYVLDVENSADESTLILLTVTYKGFSSATKPIKVRTDGDVQMLTLAGNGQAGNANFQVQVPMPLCNVERISGTLPNLQGVAQAAGSLTFLPTVPAFSITLTSTATPTENYLTGWVLSTRGWEEIIPGKVWLVRERYTYFYRLASA